jgi:excisionase family DNA binding protein
MKFEPLLTRAREGVESLRPLIFFSRVAHAGKVRPWRKGAHVIINPGHGGIWSAATRSISAANCGLTDFNHEIAVSTEMVSSSGSYLTYNEIAARLRVCRRTIEWEIARGHFPSPLKVGRCSRFTESDLLSYEQKLRENPSKLLPP